MFIFQQDWALQAGLEDKGLCQGRTHFSLQLPGLLMGGGCASDAGQLAGVTSVGQFYFRRRLFGAQDIAFV
jgi:hypothetical protein